MKKIPKILSLVVVVALIAAIPASTQIVTGDVRSTASDDNNLPLLVLVNRLELSDDQMGGLDDILRTLIAERDAMEAATTDFEQAMIDFNGTGEELDAMLVSFRETQAAAGEALRASIEASLNDVCDLLSINQGLILQEAFPQLMGGILFGADQAAPARMVAAAPMAAGRLPTAPTARGSRMSQQSARGGASMDHCSGDCEDTAAAQGRQAEAAGRVNVQTRGHAETATGRQFGQNADDGTMAEQMLERRERLGNQIREQMTDRPGGASLLMHREQSVRDEGADLFGWLEKLADMLELKFAAME